MSAGAPPIRRNDPCPCGSGKRYKECHGKLGADAPSAGDAPLERALQLHQQGRLEEAEKIYRETLEREARHAVATHYLGMAAWQRGETAEAERLMRKALELDASIPDFHNNLGLLLRDTGRAAESVERFEAALAIDPGWFEAYSNLGLALEDLGRFDAALDAYAKAIAHEPRFAAARQNRARVLLALGRFAEGWEDYRWRLVAQGLAASPPDARAGRLPRSLAGRRFELVAEQGLGDILFFLRFAPELARRGAELAFRGDARLHGMLLRTGLFGAGLASEGAAPSGLEPIFVGDLPWLLEANDPAAFPPLPLSPLEGRVAGFRARLQGLGEPPYVAVTWRAGVASSGPAHTQLKHAPASALAEALAPIGGTRISVQRLPHSGETDAVARALGRPLHDFASANEDLEEMLALLAVVDEYVGVSNANTHLRAGLGRPMSVLVPFPPEWRWGVRGSGSPWFPGMRVLRLLPVPEYGS